MPILLSALLSSLGSLFRSRAALQLENIALRHQIGVLKRSAGKRPKLTAADRLFWVFLSRVWRDWRSVLWAKRTIGSGFRLFADGKPVLEGTATSSGFAQGTWEMDPGGALLVLLQDATALKRFSITPSSETSNATLFGGAPGLAAKPYGKAQKGGNEDCF